MHPLAPIGFCVAMSARLRGEEIAENRCLSRGDFLSHKKDLQRVQVQVSVICPIWTIGPSLPEQCPLLRLKSGSSRSRDGLSSYQSHSRALLLRLNLWLLPTTVMRLVVSLRLAIVLWRIVLPLWHVLNWTIVLRHVPELLLRNVLNLRSMITL